MTSSNHEPVILLVNPWIHDFAAFDYWAKPLGLLRIASVLRATGYNVQFIDCLGNNDALIQKGKRIKRQEGRGSYQKEEIPKPPALSHIPRRFSRYGISPDHFRSMLTRIERPDAVLVTSAMTYWYPGVFEAIRIIKEVFPTVPLVLGGIYATLCGDHARAHSGADQVVEGPVLFHGGQVRTNLHATLETMTGKCLPSIPQFDRLEDLPCPAYDLLHNFDQVALATSRGCIYACGYCASRYLDGPFREREPLSVVDEIEFWRNRHGIVDFSFYDDALLVNGENRLVTLLEEVIRRKLNCRFHCPNGMHLRGMTGSMAKLIYRAGFRTLRFGFETLLPEQQKAQGGKIDNREATEAVNHLKKAGYNGEDIGFYLLCGLPGQDPSEMEASVEYVASLGVRPVITEYSPVPHTALWQEACRTSSLDLAGEPLYHNNSIFPCLGNAEEEQFIQSLKVKARTMSLTGTAPVWRSFG